MTTIIPIPAFADNYIWVLRDGDNAAVVDPGDAAPVLRYLDAQRLQLTSILTTHHHADHVGGVRTLLERVAVPVFGPAGETIPGRTVALAEGDSIVVPGFGIAFAVLDVPGHTAGHIAYFGDVGDQPVLFCGDTLFACGCGRLFEGTPAQMWQSLGKLASLPPATQVYCAHEYTLANLRFALAVEPDSEALHARQIAEQAKRDRHEPTVPSTIAIERATNPFLRADIPSVRAVIAARGGQTPPDAVAAFAALRAWKNAF